MKRVIDETLKCLLLLIFVGYIGEISLYTHAHVINGNGVTVVHSHPFHKKTSGEPFHNHSQLEFQLIKLLTSYSLTTEVIPHFQLAPVYFLIAVSEGKLIQVFLSSADTGNQYGRAPPFSGFSLIL